MASTVSAILDVVKERANNSAFSDTQLLGMYNDWQRGFGKRYPIFFQETVSVIAATASGDTPSSFTLPSDFAAPLKLFQYGSTNPRSRREIFYRADHFTELANYSESTPAAEPEVWTNWGATGTGWLFPGLSTGINVQLYYKAKFADFTSITAANTLVTSYEEVAKSGLLAEVFMSLGELKYAGAWGDRVNTMARAAILDSVERKEMLRDPTIVTPGTIKPV